jgi:hypothetical protein
MSREITKRKYFQDFCGSSLIICRSRKDTDENVVQYLELAGQLQNVYPGF